MATFYRYKCPVCGHEVRTSGLHEFYRDSKGRRKPYGHPAPISKWAKRAGIAGLSAILYCPKCDRISDRIVVEYIKPAKGTFAPLEVWGGRAVPKQRYLERRFLTCRRCHGILYLELPKNKILCPRCRKVKLKGGENFVT